LIAPPGKSEEIRLEAFLPVELKQLANPQMDLPRIAKDRTLTSDIEVAIQEVPTHHSLYLHETRDLSFLEPESVHLVVTSPPYWSHEPNRKPEESMDPVESYEAFLQDLDSVWKQCFDALAQGGRLICVVGDICLSRRQNAGRHQVVPFHASIQEHCRMLGYDNLAPIIWCKTANASHEVEKGSMLLGKPYEPNAVIKNDIQYILMERKPGGYRSPSVAARVLSVIPEREHRRWFRQIWHGLSGASTRNHSSPFPLELAERLVRMFSFVGDTVLDPFMGTGTTNMAAEKCGRNSIGVEVDERIFTAAYERIAETTSRFYNRATVSAFK